jgi:hypothetical protein
MSLKPKKKGFYLNPIAQLYLMATQLVKVLIAGRGFGKSFVNGISIMMKVASMPKSRGIFLGATYTQILTNTLLPMKSAWAWFGYKEGIDYVIGKKPPAYFDKPYQQPDRFDNVITWWNGTTIILGSMDRPQLLRGGNNDWLIADEALLIKKDSYDQIIATSIRGSHPLLKGKKGHLSEEFTSSMPYGSLGKWLLEMEADSKNPDNDTFYIQGTSWHNRVILGDEVLKKWKRNMSTTTYLIEVMNERIRQLGSLFYPSLTDNHWYVDSFDYGFIDTLGYNLQDKAQDCRWDKDRVTDLPINISHDWGAFNAITIDQYIKPKNEVRFINVMHVTHPKIIDDLANEFCDYYVYHKEKVVYQYGDKSGNKREANAKLSYFEQFAAIIRKRGWTVIKKKTGDIGHLDRHKFINKMHREQDARLPKIRHNANRCNDLRIALESAPMKDDKKDKASERNPAIKPQHATHLTDAYDYRLFHAYHRLISKSRYHSQVSFS